VGRPTFEAPAKRLQLLGVAPVSRCPSDEALRFVEEFVDWAQQNFGAVRVDVPA
jgi:hypothetical protein